MSDGRAFSNYNRDYTSDAVNAITFTSLFKIQQILKLKKLTIFAQNIDSGYTLEPPR